MKTFNPGKRENTSPTKDFSPSFQRLKSNLNKIKKVFLFVALTFIITGCPTETGYLIGSQGRMPFYQPIPYGMLFIPLGSFHMGQSEEDIAYSQTSQARTVSVQAFFMDETEITNNEYRQFVDWVRDSIAHRLLGEQFEDHLITVNTYDEEIDPPYINWREGIRWADEEQREILKEMYLPEKERYYSRREFDTRKYNYDYFWIDLRTAALKSSREQGLKDRSVFIKKETLNIYPDTLTWVHDFTYSYNEPMTEMYFWHPAYDDYPVVGVSWKQARAFCIWRTQLLNDFLEQNYDWPINRFRLPTETEWEWAARGNLDLSPYPWGGPYTRNINGCFLGNFKPLRGNYVDDGGLTTLIVAHYAPNDFGLYDMSGNVAEWTSNAFDESVYNFSHDLNTDYVYEAKDEDPEVLKRKVIRGGSWKDIGHYIRVGSRTYEYQDTSKCYIGFRCVQTYLGRAIGDSPESSNTYE